jgi:hypothetical protein
MAAHRAKELGLEDQYANVVITSDYLPKTEEPAISRGIREPKQLLQKDVYTPFPGLNL